MSTKNEKNKTIAMIEFLCNEFPNAFSHKRSGIRPLDPNIHSQLVSELGIKYSTLIKRALGFYQSKIHYLKKIESGKWYRDINGNRTTLIPYEEKEHASIKLKNILIRKEQSAADTKE